MDATCGIVFDLDDTIYPEREYVRSGFEQVASMLERTCGVRREELSEFLERLFANGVRGDTFDRLLEAYPRVARWFSVAEVVEAYRTHEPRISAFPGILKLLRDLRAAGARLALLSDGPPASQRAKFECLQLHTTFDKAVFTGSLTRRFPKPGTDGFLAAVQDWHVPPERLTYVGDNPQKDFAAPNQLGWRTVRLRLPVQLRCEDTAPFEQYEARIEVRSVAELAAVLRQGSCPDEVKP